MTEVKCYGRRYVAEVTGTGAEFDSGRSRGGNSTVETGRTTDGVD